MVKTVRETSEWEDSDKLICLIAQLWQVALKLQEQFPGDLDNEVDEVRIRPATLTPPAPPVPSSPSARHGLY